MTLVAGNYDSNTARKMYFYKYDPYSQGQNANTVIFYDKDGNNKSQYSYDHSKNPAPIFNYNNGTDNQDVFVSVYGTLVGNEGWVDHQLTYNPATDKFESNYYNLNGKCQFVLRIKSNRTDGSYDSGNQYAYAHPASTAALTKTLKFTGDNISTDATSSLSGMYKLVFDFETMTLEAVSAGQATNLDVTPTEADETACPSGTLFYQKSFPLTLTPTTDVASWTVKITDPEGNSVTRSFSGNAAQTVNIEAGDYDENKTYTVTVTLYDTDGNPIVKTFAYKRWFDDNRWSNADKDNYYFYGDMNFWSRIELEKNDADSNGHYYYDRTTGEGLEIGEVYNGKVTTDTKEYIPDGNPHFTDHYASYSDMIEKWRFQPVAKADLPAAITENTSLGDLRDKQWYVFDCSKVTTIDGAHSGHLCGQFKIYPGVFNENKRVYAAKDGGDAYNTDTENGNTVKANTLFKLGKKNGSGKNVRIYNNIYNNAKIYFFPGVNVTDGDDAYIYIEASKTEQHDAEQDLYAYYWNQNQDVTFTADNIKINSGNQFNYISELNDNYKAVPEKIANGTTFWSNGRQYTSDGRIWRVRLPKSSEHRSPIAFSATLSSPVTAGLEVMREIRCADIWLIESKDLNIKFSAACADASVNRGPITYTLNVPRFNDNGAIVGIDHPIENATMKPEGNAWVGTQKIPGQYASGTTVTFKTAFGESFETEVNGDVNYTFDCGDDARLEILYTHLKGTYGLDNGHGLQIEAELYTDENTINTSYSDVDYTFTVYDVNGNELDTQTSTQPFYKWKPTAAGWYNIKVSATDNVTGQIATVYDRYPVYDNQLTQAQANLAQAPVAPKAAVSTSKTYYIETAACEWARDANAEFYVKDGSNSYKCTLDGTMLTFRFTNSNPGTLTLNRCNPNTNGTDVWNHFDFDAPTGDNDLFTTNSDFNGGSWSKYVEPTTYTIYFDSSSTDWTNVYTWIWNKDNKDENFSGAAWPGAVMTQDSKSGYWKFSFKSKLADENILVLFNKGDGEASKTDNFVVHNNGIYNTSGYTNKTYDPTPVQLAAPVFNPGDGTEFEESGEVTITSYTEGATIHYTLNDGAEQTGTSPVTVALNSKGSFTITAWTSKTGAIDSEHVSATFKVSEKYVYEPEELGDPAPQFFLADFEQVNVTNGTGKEGYSTLLSSEGTHHAYENVNFSWAKFEDYIHTDGSSYDDIVFPTSTHPYRYQYTDNESLKANTTNEHKCRNWHPAYYRIYMTVENKAAAYKNANSNGAHGDIHATHQARIARTIEVTHVSTTSPSTGIEDITGEGADTEAPVQYYDLNGRLMPADGTLPPGFYIRRQGATATKVYVK